MIKIASLLRIWYSLFIGLAILFSALFIRSEIHENNIANKIQFLENHADSIHSFLLSKENQFAEESSGLLKEGIFKVLPFKEILISNKTRGVLYCHERIIKNGVTVFNNCGQKYKPTDLTYTSEFLKATRNESKTGYDVRYHSFSTSKSDFTRYIHFVKHFDRYSIRLTDSYGDVIASNNSIDNLLIIFSAFGFFILLLINILLSNIIVSPLRLTGLTLNKYIRDIKQRFSYSKIDEIATLQLALNEFAKSVEKKILETTGRKNQAEAVVKNVSEGVLILDKKLRIILYNNGLFSLLNINSEVYYGEIEKKYYYEVVRNNKFNQLIEDSAKEGKRLSQNIQLSALDSIILKVTCIPLPNKSGMVVMIDNVTEQHKLMEMKKSFVENASHEFKTPISIIKGYLETLLKSQDISLEDQKKYLHKVLRNADRLSNLIKDLITLNKLDESGTYFKQSPVKVYYIIENCLDILSLKAEEKGITLSNLISSHDIQIKGNPELLETIFFNLIDNGITYTESGGSITINMHRKEDRLDFLISDTGIGIPLEHRERIFERFYRIDEGRSRKSGGTGLGLSIVKHAVMFHDAQVFCEANPNGLGTQFRLTFKALQKDEDDDYELDSSLYKIKSEQ